MMVVAHRMAIIQKADIIIVQGRQGESGARILERGSHGELIASRGVHYQMWQSQSQALGR